jgi:hypothetical protein
MATPQQQEAVFREGRLQLANQAYNTSQIQSNRAAAEAYDVKKDTLKRRRNGVLPQRGSIAKNRLLALTEEAILEQCILSLDRRGMLLTVATVRVMASLLASQHGRQITVGKNWVYNFIKRHETLKSKYNHKYDYKRA